MRFAHEVKPDGGQTKGHNEHQSSSDLNATDNGSPTNSHLEQSDAWLLDVNKPATLTLTVPDATMKTQECAATNAHTNRWTEAILRGELGRDFARVLLRVKLQLRRAAISTDLASEVGLVPSHRVQTVEQIGLADLQTRTEASTRN